MKKCPYCGNEVDDDSKFCSKCGYKFIDDPAHEIRHTGPVASPKVSKTNPQVSETTAIDRNDPKFKKNCKICFWSSLFSFVGSLISLGGSLIMRFTNMGGTEFGLGLAMMLIGMIAFIVLFFGICLPLGKKTYGSAKPKGFYENFPGIMMGLGFVCVFGALFLQGYFLILR